MFRDSGIRLYLVFLLTSTLYMFSLSYYCLLTHSLALNAYSSLLLYDVMYFLTFLIMLCINKSAIPAQYPFGYERLDVLGIFVSTIINILMSLSIIKHAIESLFETYSVVTTYHTFTFVIVNILFSCVFSHILRTNCPHYELLYSNQSNTISYQHKLYKNVTFLSSLLPGKMSALTIVNIVCGIAVILSQVLIELDNLLHADIVATIFITSMTICTFLPIAISTGRILLQCLSPNDVQTVDKLLREASTFDGVIEIQREFFWRVGFKSLAASMHVKVKEESNSQQVLSQLFNHFAPHLSYLTIQVLPV
ncbi:Zinc transporter 6-A-like [Oopsacas minuta]|uniref:Zinc transporter 6-A-like n=1 Tax=Oopsacas minuta TaxID=111878 RepID=A0AAV7JUR4_9METZ|nr:Zinc transporter 6-A-like [Oopsacas minuta]